MFRTIIQRAQHIADLHRDHRTIERDTAALQLARDLCAAIDPAYPLPTPAATAAMPAPPCALPGHTPARLWHTTGN